MNGLTSLAINKLDVLMGIQKLKICIAYKLSNGKVTQNFPPVLEDLDNCTPIYEEFDGFYENISKCKSFYDLPDSCKRYIQRLSDLCGCKVSSIGIGSGRNQSLYC